jgi:hypothetical protein
MASTSQGTVVVDHAAAVSRVNAMFNAWKSVPTTSIAFSNTGGIPATSGFSDGDVSTLAEFNAVVGACKSGIVSPIIFDANGEIFRGLNIDSDVIGFTSACAGSGSHFIGAFVLMNGTFQDHQTSNDELSDSQFDEAITHEIGHFIGLDHSQINEFPQNCDIEQMAGRPLMFPIIRCDSRTSQNLPIIAPDDAAWVSYLYPNASFNSNYGFIEGQVLFPDGVTPVQGANVIARHVEDPNTPEHESIRLAVSVVSGFLFTSNPGQSVSGDNNEGSQFGSRAADREGYFKIPVPAGQWTIEVESVDPAFVDGSRVGPLSPPVPAPGIIARINVSVSAGSTTNVNVQLIGPAQPRFDDFEDESRLRVPIELQSIFAEGVHA